MNVRTILTGVLLASAGLCAGCHEPGSPSGDDGLDAAASVSREEITVPGTLHGETKPATEEDRPDASLLSVDNAQPVGAAATDIVPTFATSASVAERGTKPAASAATSPGKPLPPIAFDYRILGTPVAGQPLEIEISTGVEAALADLNVALSGNERLLVPIEMARLRLVAAAAGQRATRTVRVTPVASGTVYLDVLLEAEIDGRLQSRAVTIPIRVGDDATPEPPAGTPSTDAEGTPIISLPGRDD